MRLRPYDAQRDYPCIVSWITDERTHALWCARLIPYPVTEERFHALLSDQAARWGGAWVMTDERDVPAGFFCYSCDSDHTGFLRFVVVDSRRRGMGYGRELLRHALRYAFGKTGAEVVRLNVFTVNTAAVRCYVQVGFAPEETVENALDFHGERWSRCTMAVRWSATGT